MVRQQHVRIDRDGPDLTHVQDHVGTGPGVRQGTVGIHGAAGRWQAYPAARFADSTVL